MTTIPQSVIFRVPCQADFMAWHAAAVEVSRLIELQSFGMIPDLVSPSSDAKLIDVTLPAGLVQSFVKRRPVAKKP